MDLRHNQARGRPITPGTSTPSPSPLPTAFIAPVAGAPGHAAARGWELTFERQTPPEIDPLTGWTLSTDPLSQVRLRFPDMASAIAFAERKGWRYEFGRAQASRPTIRFNPVWAQEVRHATATA